MSTHTHTLLLLGAIASLSGCATHFTGEATFPDGPRGCFDRCRAQSMEMGAYVYAGEYSTACVCVPPHAPRVAGATGGVTAAAVAVVTQMRQQQQAAAAGARPPAR